MNDSERKLFWGTLMSLKGVDIEADKAALQKTIIPPRFLYRYRAVNTKTLEALRTNKLYFSTASFYDDPFDTFINIDFSGFIRICDLMKSMEDEGTDREACMNVMHQFFDAVLPKRLSDELMQAILEQLKNNMRYPVFRESIHNYIRECREAMKQGIRSVCFSESGLNEVMWLKYADQYKGFAVQYDLYDPTLHLCGKLEKCSACGFRDGGTSLYPMYYADEQYDGTRFAMYLMLFDGLLKTNQLAPEQIQNVLITMLGNMNWERERISLIKKKCHQEDVEWRGIVDRPMTGTIMQEWIPSSIYLGLRMGETEKNLVIALAKEAGIRAIMQTIINDRGMLDLVKVEA